MHNFFFAIFSTNARVELLEPLPQKYLANQALSVPAKYLFRFVQLQRVFFNGLQSLIVASCDVDQQ